MMYLLTEASGRLQDLKQRAANAQAKVDKLTGATKATQVKSSEMTHTPTHYTVCTVYTHTRRVSWSVMQVETCDLPPWSFTSDLWY